MSVTPHYTAARAMLEPGSGRARGDRAALTWPALAALLAFVVPLACVNWIKDCAEQIVRCAAFPALESIYSLSSLNAFPGLCRWTPESCAPRPVLRKRRTATRQVPRLLHSPFL